MIHLSHLFFVSTFPFPPVWLLRKHRKKKKTEVFGVMIVSIVLSIFFLRNFVSNPVVLDGGSITDLNNRAVSEPCTSRVRAVFEVVDLLYDQRYATWRIGHVSDPCPRCVRISTCPTHGRSTKLPYPCFIGF